MYLKTLTLRGFKSFASATRFDFEPGVTCVVGPNGSGKSNVVDALAWVMGEQGVKTLRGGKMEDVIFAGTSGRTALGRAEVSLTIDNTDGALPIDFAEVTITRTLFRNGGSEYAINGSSCRLLDIQDLLSDSGLGREMHVIVGQGQLDGILRATPLERRGFIEEAAGVLKHRKRKEKALRKLESMQGNLLRLSDLITELRRQLGPLGKQAHAARKAAVIAALVRDSGLRLLADDLNQAINAKTDSERRTRSARDELTRLEENAQLLRARLAAMEAASLQLGPAAQHASDVHTRLISAREQLRSLSQIASERNRHLGSTLTTEASRSTEEIERQLERARSSLHEASTELDVATAALLTAQTERQNTHEEYAKRVNRRDAERTARAARRERIAQLSAKVASARSRVESLDSSFERVAHDIAEAQSRLDHAQQQELVANSGVAGDETVPVSGESSLDQLVLLEQELRDELASHARETGALREQHVEVERQFATHSARATALESAIATTLGAAHTLVAHDSQLVHFSDHLVIPDRHSKPLHAALAHFVYSVVAQSLDHASQVADAAHEMGLPATTIAYPRPTASSNVSSSRASLRNGELWAKDVVEFRTENEALSAYLSQVVITQPERAAQLLHEDQSLIIVSEQGTVYTSQAVTSAAMLDPIVGLNRDLKDETERVANVELKVAELRHQIQHSDTHNETLRSRLNAASAQLAQAHSVQRENEATRARTAALTHAAHTELVRLTQRHNEIVASREKAQTDLTALTGELEAANREDAETRPHSHEAPSADHPHTLGQLEAAITELEATLERTREIETLARLDVRTAQEKQKNLHNRVSGLERSLAAETRALENAQRAAHKRERQAFRARVVRDRANDALSRIEHSIAQALVARDEATQERDRYTRELNLLRVDVSTIDGTVRELTTTLHSLELDLAARSTLVESLDQRAVSEYSMAPAEVVTGYGPHTEVPHYEIPKLRGSLDEAVDDADLTGVQAFDRQYLENAHQRALKALSGLGTVNPLALEEYSALEERHAFLNEQLTDLKKSRTDLLALVDDIDERVQQVFASAFADTARQFATVFPRLFPGGEGSMYLTEPDDLLNTGIEIEARPAGKKVKRLSLLSGGERSLTAIAMLVSIFMARPSPFYVMDEVEAALDDVNLGRLLSVFKDLQQDSQLIVITHQKRTMEIADALYGVTMQGDGVSAVISQRIHHESSVM